MVSSDSIYSEMSGAALRHRNYETETARWYTTILVAILGFVLTAKFGEPQSGVAELLSGSVLVQIAFSAIVVSIAVSSCYSIQYYHRQHMLLERYVDTLLEPEEIDRRVRILKMPKLKPRFLLMWVQMLLALIIVVLILM